MEQLVRDARIMGIYEGSNGIQAMDLLARQLGKKKGGVFMNLLGEIGKTVAQAKETPGLANMAARVEDSTSRLAELAMYMGKTAMSDKILTAFSTATPFLEIMGDIILGWMHLWRGVLASEKLDAIVGIENGDQRRQNICKNKDALFYDGLVKGADYYINSLLPITFGKMDAVKFSTAAVVDMEDASFGGK